MTFLNLGLSDPILNAVQEQGYAQPTDIQQQAIPAIIDERDVFASAQTGTGKTASFVLPLLEKLTATAERRAKYIRALILVPTRELALQINTSIETYGRYTDVTSMAMVGGVASDSQKQQLIDGIDILVATPGRLLDLLNQRALRLEALTTLVLDEADRMVDMGFMADVRKIMSRLPEQRQNLFFSATLSDSIHRLADDTLINPLEIFNATQQSATPKINQWIVAVDKDIKSALLSHLIHENQWTQGLIFIRTKHGAAKLVSQLEKRGIAAEAFHSGRSQPARTQLMADFKAGNIPFLVATGVAARGIDIDNLPRVINYDLPDDADDYIHRIGRTGRAGETGDAVSLVSRDDFKRLCAIERRQQKVIERKIIDGFEVKKDLPPSDLNYVPKPSNKPAPERASNRKPSAKPRKAPKARKPATSQEASTGALKPRVDPWAKSRDS